MTRKNKTLRLTFIVALGLLLFLSIVTYTRLTSLINSGQLVNHTTQVTLELERTLSSIKDAVSGHHGYLLTGDISFLESFNADLETYPKHIQTLKELIKDNPVQVNNLQQIEILCEHRKQAMLHLLEINKKRKPIAEELLVGKFIMDSLQAQASNMIGIENNLMTEREAQLKKQMFLAPAMIFILSIIAFLILFISYRQLNKALLRSQQLQSDVANKNVQLEISKQQQNAYEQSEKILSDELATTQQLHKISTQLIYENNTTVFYEQLLDAAMVLMNSDFASIQKFNPSKNELTLLAQRNFHPQATEFWSRVSSQSQSSCAVAFNRQERIIVPDIEISDTYANSDDLKYSRLTGIRAVQSTPLISRDGKFIGMISTHWKIVHHPAKYSFQLFDVLGRQAADLIERMEQENSLEEKVKQRTEEFKESEEKFSKLFSASPMGLTLSEIPSGKLIDVNDTLLEMVGYTREEYIGHTSLELNLIDISEREKILKPLMQNGFVKNAEVNIRTKSGKLLPILNSVETIFIANKKYFLSAMIDISQHKKAEDSLRQSEEKYHSMVAEVQDYAIILLSKEGIIENWNKGAEKIKGYKAEEAIGNSFSMFYTEEDRKNNFPEKLLTQARQTGKATDENWRVRKDGSRFWGSIVITALHNDKNEVNGFVKVTRDLSERKIAEESIKAKAEQLEIKNIELEKINKELESFAYISSHDLQEPLRKIQTFATRIVEKEFYNLSDNGKDNFTRMQLAAKRMQTLIEDLLAYSRTNTADRKFELTDLNKIIDEVKEDLKEDLVAKHAILETTELCEVNIIPFQFRQLMNNLIGNALKFSHNGNAPHIKIKSKIEPGAKFNNPELSPQTMYCHISVSDNGIGFEPQYSEKIFEVFQRLHGNTVYSGTGIGLSIVKKIVENHHGFITATGELNKGAQFDIYIPAT